MGVRRIVASPWPYAAWLLLVVAAFLVTYPIDPYVYAFGVLGLAWVSGAVALAGIAGIVIAARGGRKGAAWGIGLALAGTTAAVAIAMAILSTFRWN